MGRLTQQNYWPPFLAKLIRISRRGRGREEQVRSAIITIRVEVLNPGWDNSILKRVFEAALRGIFQVWASEVVLLEVEAEIGLS